MAGRERSHPDQTQTEGASGALILRAAWVLPIAEAPIPQGFVRVTGGRIAAVGRWGQRDPETEQLAKRPGAGGVGAGGVGAGGVGAGGVGAGGVGAGGVGAGGVGAGGVGVSPANVVDLGDAALMPGLVNPHTHLELTCYAGQIPPASFWAWLPALVRLRFAPGQVDREREAVRDGAWRSLHAGVTCVGDISRTNLAWPVLKELPIRKVCFVELLSLADQPPRTLEDLQAALAAVEEDALLTAGVTPHAPYTVPAEQLAGALALAQRWERPWCAHWAETREERRFLHEAGSLHPFLDELLARCGIRPPRCSAIEYLERIARDRPPGALAHCNYLEPGEADRLAAAGHIVMYCPRAHRFFGHDPHPYAELLRAGVRVALGTDSAASNEDLSLLREAQLLFSRDDPYPRSGFGRVAMGGACDTHGNAPQQLFHPGGVGEPLSARDLLRMITTEAAAALGMQDRIGTLEVGKCADLAAFPCSTDAAEPEAEIVRNAPAPRGVWVAGRRVVG